MSARRATTTRGAVTRAGDVVRTRERPRAPDEPELQWPVAEQAVASTGAGADRYPLNVDWRALIYLTAIVDQGSIGRAAKALHLTQPALSKSMRRLERALKLRLFERTSRGIALTRDGERVLQHARAVAATLTRAERDVGTMRGLGAGRVYVGTGRSVPPQLLAAALASPVLGASPPQVLIVDDGTERLLQRVQLGEVDFALVTAEVDEIPPTLSATLLLRDPGVVTARRGHPLANRERLGAATLAAAEWVVPPRPHPLWRQMTPLAAAHGQPLRIRAQTASLSIARELVARSDALTVLPRSIVTDRADSGLVELPATDFDWSLPVTVVSRGADLLSLDARRLLEALPRQLQSRR